MLARLMELYRISSFSRWRPYVGWLPPISILTATEGCPFLQTGICLCSRSMEVLKEILLVSAYS